MAQQDKCTKCGSEVVQKNKVKDPRTRVDEDSNTNIPIMKLEVVFECTNPECGDQQKLLTEND